MLSHILREFVTSFTVLPSLEAQGHRLVVAAGGRTTLEILEIQLAGRRIMKVHAFLAGHTVTSGSLFESSTRQ